MPQTELDAYKAVDTNDLKTAEPGADPLKNAVLCAGSFARSQTGKIGEKYRGIKTLGTGAFGTVLAIEDRRTGERLACKCLLKSNLDRRELSALQQEISLLRSCDHPNIMRFYAYFEDHKQVFLVCELCEGGELFDYITDASFYADKSRQNRELNAAVIMKQFLSGVAYLHALNIVHRDLKPENVLLKNKKDIHNLKIIDLGLGARYHGEKMSEQVGTPYYIAPEILEKNYGPLCDVWSMGVILYILIAGQAPFWGKDDKAILRKVREHKFSMSGEVWQKASPEVKDLITKMLTYPASKRISAYDALQHPWFKKVSERKSIPVGPDQSVTSIMTKLRKFRGHQKLQHAVRLCISYHAKRDAEIDRLTRIFQEMDTDGNGVLDEKEVRAVYCQLESNQGRNTSELSEDVVRAEVKSLFERIDVNKDGFVGISEWLAGTLEDKYILSRERLRDAFRTFDADNSGTISVDEIVELLNLSKDSRSDVAAIFKEHDRNNDGELDFDEFVGMIEVLAGGSDSEDIPTQDTVPSPPQVIVHSPQHEPTATATAGATAGAPAGGTAGASTGAVSSPTRGATTSSAT